MAYRIVHQKNTWPHTGFCPGCNALATITWNLDAAPCNEPATAGTHRGMGVCDAHQRMAMQDPGEAQRLAAMIWTHQEDRAA